jgi:hypothetical protein
MAGHLPQAMYLHAHTKTSWRDQLLPCSINHLIRNVGSTTPLDVFVFVRTETYDKMSSIMAQRLENKDSHVCVLPIAPEQWSYQQPRAVPYQLPNNTNRYRDYLVMVSMCVCCVAIVDVEMACLGTDCHSP